MCIYACVELTQDLIILLHRYYLWFMVSVMAYRLFEENSHALLYAKFRPTYPSRAKELIAEFVNRNGGSFQKMVDVACGSGQSTFYMANLFSKVIGVDISQAQVNQAQAKSKQFKYDNVEFSVGSAEDLPFEDSSVDVVTCAAALHWLDEKKFYSEADRILKSKGVMAAYGYGYVEPEHEKCRATVTQFYQGTLKGYWADRLKYAENCFKDFRLPYANSERYYFFSDVELTLPDFIGYVSSLSGYCNYCKHHPGSTVLHQLEQDLHQELGSDVSKELVTMKLQIPFFILLGQKEKCS